MAFECILRITGGEARRRYIFVADSNFCEVIFYVRLAFTGITSSHTDMSMINLGRSIKTDDVFAQPIESIESLENQGQEMIFPSLYLSDREGMSSVPAVGTEGEAMIRFRVVSKTESDKTGSTSTSVDLEVMSIEFNGDESEEDDDIERGLRESEQEVEDEEDEEEEK